MRKRKSSSLTEVDAALSSPALANVSRSDASQVLSTIVLQGGCLAIATVAHSIGAYAKDGRQNLRHDALGHDLNRSKRSKRIIYRQT